ncbi:NAD(P)-binding protein [Coniochaeta sp. PMI_546]|nr:NAD(P)-binding protein [Coniochaeta sp. PMI_546]
MTGPPLPATMKQLLQPSIHSPNLILTTAPVPTPTAPDDVLIRTAATSPCKDELAWAQNPASPAASGKEAVPCLDLAGTVVRASCSSGFEAGDHVFACVSPARAGAAREYALAKVGELARVPGRLDWVAAAATPLSALTAWQALFVRGTLEAGGLKGEEAGARARARNARVRVLVTGAAGGVGGWAVQFAGLAGATVVAVCGAGKEGVVRELGAAEVVDYTRTSIEEWVARDAARGVDLVVDTVGGRSLASSWSAVRPGGAIVSICSPPDMAKPAGVEKRLSRSLFFVLETSGANLAEIAGLLEAGKVHPLIDSVWSLEEYEKAFERLDSGQARGKVVIKVRRDSEQEVVPPLE